MENASYLRITSLNNPNRRLQDYHYISFNELKKVRKMKDKIMFGAIVGLLADGVKLIVNYIGFLLKFSDVVFWQITATRFLAKNELFSPLAYVIGGLADLTMAALLGIVFIYILTYTGRDYDYFKGVGFGLAVWVVLFGTVLGHSVQSKLSVDPSGIVVTAIAHLVFGLMLSFFARKLWKQGVAS